MNNHLNPIFRGILNRAAGVRTTECAECRVLASVGHSFRCSKYVQPAPINWSADGFVRTERGYIAGFATGNEVTREQIALVEQEADERRAREIDAERLVA